MALNIPLEEMSTQEKLQAMEAIWADLSRDPDQIPVPEWHREVLEERERRIQSGEEKFLDWETAKKQLRDRLNEN